jgi:hypothetical protein
MERRAGGRRIPLRTELRGRKEQRAQIERHRLVQCGAAGARYLEGATDPDIDRKRDLEAPPGFEPGMEVFQTERTHENSRKSQVSGLFLCRLLGGVGWEETDC